MGRKPVEKTCCACLAKGSGFNRLSKKDQKKVTLLTKLKMCIKEVTPNTAVQEWTVAYHICIECTNLLNTSYTFRETCLNADCIRTGEQEIVKTDEDEFKEETLAEIALEMKVTEDCNKNKDEIKDAIKDEEKSEEVDVFFRTVNGLNDKDDVDDPDDLNDPDAVNDPSYCSESDQENDNVQSDLDNEKYEHAKRKKLRKVRKHQEKVENPTRKRKKLKFDCEKCASSFSASTKLVEHCIKEHGMKFKDVKPFVCDRCPQRFSTSSNLWQHIKYHDGIKSKMCSYCGKGFITKTDLMNHEKKHLNMREYKCEACGKSFNTHKDIRSHKLIVHTDSSAWKYVCEICNKPFPIKSNYDSHMRRHTGDKKFACHLCEKKFTTKCDLQRHTRSHSHVREHRCQHCEKEYKDERVLKVHMAKIHGIGLGKVKIPVRERKFACHFCPKAYYAKNKLTRHIYTHSGEKPFNCPVCEKKFNDKSYVKQHLRNTHNVEHQDTLENELKISCMNSSGPDVMLG